MSAMASQITGVSIVYSTICSSTDQRKHRSSASLAFLREINRWLVNSSHKGPVTRKRFPFDDVIIWCVLQWPCLLMTQKEASLYVHDMLSSVGYRIYYPNVIFSVAAYIDWQLIDNKGIPGHNIRDFPNIMLQACKELCMAEQPWCRSIDYYWPTGQCALSDVAFGDPGIYSWAEYPGLQYYSFCGKSYMPGAPFTNLV